MPKVAILMYGLTRDLETTAPRFYKHLFDVMKQHGMEYDLYVHTYLIHGAYHNTWAGEHTDSYKNEDVQGLLHPTCLSTDNQEEVLAQLNVTQYYTMPMTWSAIRYMAPDRVREMVKNMCLGLYSKKKVTESFLPHRHKYSAAMIIRPELLLKNTFPVSVFSTVRPGTIVLPMKDNYQGCNDRICVGTPDTIAHVGTMFDALLPYSTYKIVNSEIFMMDRVQWFIKVHVHIEYETKRIKRTT